MALVIDQSMSSSQNPSLSGPVTLLKNAALSTSVMYVESIAGLAIGVLIARTLGPVDYGHYVFAVWLCAWMILASNNGLNLAAIRFIAEFRGSSAQSIAEALSVRLLRWQTLCSAAVLLIFCVLAAIWPPADWMDQQWSMIVLAVIAVSVRARFWLLSSIGRGYERFAPESVSLLAMVVANLVAIGLWWQFNRTVIGAFFVYALTGVICSLIARYLIKANGIKFRDGFVPDATHQRVVRTVLSSGALIVLGLVSGRVFEMALLKAFWTAETIAYFAIAGALTKGAVDLLAGGLASILLPVMSRAFGRAGKDQVAKIMVESIRYYWFIGLLIAGLGLVITAGAVTLLYGPRYQTAIPVVTYTLVIAGLGAISTGLSAFQTASDFQTDRLWTAGATVAINAVAAIALVPVWGLTGAVMSLAITRAASLAVQFYYVRRRVQVPIKWEILVRLLFCALVAGEAAVIVEGLLSSRFSFVLSGALFCGLFVFLTVVLRAWYAHDYALVAELAARLGPLGERIALMCRRVGKRFAIR